MNNGVPRIFFFFFFWGGGRPKDRRPRAGAGILGRGSNLSHQRERSELPQWGSGRRSDRPKVSTIFSTQDGLS